MSLRPRYLFLLALVFFVACTKDIGRVNRGNYPDEIGKLITLNCAVEGCHNSASALAASAYNLESWETMFKGSNNGSPVIPYSSKYSSLCYYINTYPDLGLQNKPTMPLNRKALSHEDVRRIKQWIDDGAPDINGNIKWANDPQRKKMYVANQGCDVVTVIDAETQLPIRYVEVGNKPGPDTPHQIRVSPDGKYWYVIFINNNVMEKYSCADDRYIGRIPLTPAAAGTGAPDALDWNTFVISSDGKRAYCVSWTTNGRVASVDLEQGKFLRFLPGFFNSHGIVLNKAEDKLYITNQQGNYITELDTAFENARQIYLKDANEQPTLNMHDIILSPDGKQLVVTCQGSNEVRFYDIAADAVTTIIRTGLYPQEIVYSKTGNAYYVSCMEDTLSFPGSHGSIMRITASFRMAHAIPCGFQPHGIAVDENKGLLYVASRNYLSSGPLPHHTSQCAGKNGFLNFVDLGSFSVMAKKYELSVDPYFVIARP